MSLVTNRVRFGNYKNAFILEKGFKDKKLVLEKRGSLLNILIDINKDNVKSIKNLGPHKSFLEMFGIYQCKVVIEFNDGRSSTAVVANSMYEKLLEAIK